MDKSFLMKCAHCLKWSEVQYQVSDSGLDGWKTLRCGRCGLINNDIRATDEPQAKPYRSFQFWKGRKGAKSPQYICEASEEELLRDVEQGDIRAMSELGARYYRHYMNAEEEKWEEWKEIGKRYLETAAEAGDPEAIDMLNGKKRERELWAYMVKR